MVHNVSDCVLSNCKGLYTLPMKNLYIHAFLHTVYQKLSCGWGGKSTSSSTPCKIKHMAASKQ